MWQKKGHIYSPSRLLPWAQSHAQMPTSYLASEEEITILFSSRDNKNISRIGSIIVSANDPSLILKHCNRIILDIGNSGAFDDSGVMPSSIVKVNSKYFLYYIGWNERKKIPYHNSIGLAISNDGVNFSRMFEGPILERSAIEPYFCSAPYVIYDSGLWRMWYLSCTEWVNLNSKLEPRYHIKYAESHDGIFWNRSGKVSIDYKNDDEGGIVRPSIIKKKNGGYRMWFSYRKLIGYRDDAGSSYRIGYAESSNGIDWNRCDENAGITVSDSGWDSLMIEYPDIINFRDKTYMFYNGNGFGLTGIGYATF